MSPYFDPEATRRAFVEALPSAAATHNRPPEPRYLYVPQHHMQALSPDHGLVVGIRGTGKSVWWAALQSDEHRKVVSDALHRPILADVATVDAGFGVALRPDDYPDKRVLGSLLRAGRKPSEIWRTVVAWHTWGKPERDRESPLAAIGTWSGRVEWMETHPEEAARAFWHADEALAARGKRHLVLFDALDRTADEWPILRQLLRGLLEVLLDLRAYRGIRAKAFVRPDMLDDPAVTAFRDASKVTAGKVDLRWVRTDLYSLLFQYLANAREGGEAFRRGYEQFRHREGGGIIPLVLEGPTPPDSFVERDGIWQIPILLDHESQQHRIFDEIAGKWMGSNPRRGLTYTWLVNHLADAARQASPRSFLVALRTAAEKSSTGRHALDFEGIKKGVQAASQIRVDEVKEDFFWVPILMEPLRGLAIPCAFNDIERRWREAGVVEKLRREAERGSSLLPRRIDDGYPGLRNDLLNLALFSLQRYDRINMPDVYRVAFGLGRRGGIKPLR